MKNPGWLSPSGVFCVQESGGVGSIFLPDGVHDCLDFVEIESRSHFDARYFTTLNPRINRVGAD
jgi:hypothetical protein